MTDIKSFKLKKRLTAGQILIIGFAAVILIGTTLLTLPISSQSGEFTSVRTAKFTSVSATCVTGLIIEDTALYWSGFGQTVIICMIQIGGLGFMTMTVLFSMLIKRTITPRERIIISQSLGLNTNSGMISLVRRILIGTFAVEGIGAAILATQFIPIFGLRDGIIKGIFHSISAFCNAGFDLLGTYSGAYSSFASFRDNVVVNVTLMLLILIGGIGFIIWDDIVDWIKKRDRITVYTKFILICSAILVFGGALVILLIEYNNPKTIGNLPFGEKLLASFFQAVTTRTAGFATIDNTLFTDAGKVFSMFLMFIGGASGSTAGGVKVGTV
nr:Trk family potassium uptake protein [Clostridia bacterium]